MNKKANSWMVVGIIGIVLSVILGIILITNLTPKQECTSEHGLIVYGSGGIPSGECCEGLIEKSPAGWTGSSFCMKPECNINCNAIGTESEGFH